MSLLNGTLPFADHFLCSQQAYCEWNDAQLETRGVTPSNIANHICMMGGMESIFKQGRLKFKGAKAIEKTVAAAMALDETMLGWLESRLSKGYEEHTDRVEVSLDEMCMFHYKVFCGLTMAKSRLQKKASRRPKLVCKKSVGYRYLFFRMQRKIKNKIVLNILPKNFWDTGIFSFQCRQIQRFSAN